MQQDRRVQRTRLGLLTAFGQLVLERGYDNTTVRDIIERANVGRSTFYEHFANKDDVLRRSLAPVFGVLADAVVTAAPDEQLDEILEHFWENRRLTRAMLRGSTHHLMSQILADLIEERLAELPRSARVPRLRASRELLAAQLAGGQLGLLVAWLNGKPPCSRDVVARALHAGTHGTLSAVLAQP